MQVLCVMYTCCVVVHLECGINRGGKIRSKTSKGFNCLHNLTISTHSHNRSKLELLHYHYSWKLVHVVLISTLNQKTILWSQCELQIVCESVTRIRQISKWITYHIHNIRTSILQYSACKEFTTINFIVSSTAVIIGGWPFIEGGVY